MTVDDAGPRIRIMVVDDHVMVRRGLVMLLDTFDDMLLVGEAAIGNEAVRLCHEVKPHVIVMDIVMPDLEGVETVRRICRADPDARVIMISSVCYRDKIEEALAAGARCFIAKPVTTDQLKRAIEEALAPAQVA